MKLPAVSLSRNMAVIMTISTGSLKKATGKTMLAYLNELRISKARQLLSDGTSQISRVAEQCGFHDIYYFSRVFKKYTGTTPGAFSRKCC